MIAARRLQCSFADGFIAGEVTDLWEPWMRHADEALNDDQLLEIIQEELSDKPPPQGGGSGNGLKALFRPEAGKMSPAPSGLQEVDGLNHLL